jgi:putative hydrolase of the HAD superfamily
MNVVFDFGGVLLRWQPHEIVAGALPDLASTRAAADRLVAGIFEGFGGDWGEFDRGTLDIAPLAERIARRTGLSTAQARAVIDAVPAALVPIEATVKLLERLHRRGTALYFLSNMPAPFARGLEATQDFLQHFRAGVFSADVKLIKPEPAIYAHATERFGADPARTLFIDDMPANVAAAQAHGWQGLHFRSAAQLEVELLGRGLLSAEDV